MTENYQKQNFQRQKKIQNRKKHQNKKCFENIFYNFWFPDILLRFCYVCIQCDVDLLPNTCGFVMDIGIGKTKLKFIHAFRLYFLVNRDWILEKSRFECMSCSHFLFPYARLLLSKVLTICFSHVSRCDKQRQIKAVLFILIWFLITTFGIAIDKKNEM